MLVGDRGFGKVMMPGAEMARSSSDIFGLGQQVPHRGGGAWRYSDQIRCSDQVYGGPCAPDELFGLGQQVPHRGGGAWRYSPSCNDEIYGSCDQEGLFGLSGDVGFLKKYPPETWAALVAGAGSYVYALLSKDKAAKIVGTAGAVALLGMGAVSILLRFLPIGKDAEGK